jgi:hypothetical protein
MSDKESKDFGSGNTDDDLSLPKGILFIILLFYYLIIYIYIYIYLMEFNKCLIFLFLKIIIKSNCSKTYHRDAST